MVCNWNTCIDVLHYYSLNLYRKKSKITAKTTAFLILFHHEGEKKCQITLEPKSWDSQVYSSNESDLVFPPILENRNSGSFLNFNLLILTNIWDLLYNSKWAPVSIFFFFICHRLSIAKISDYFSTILYYVTRMWQSRERVLFVL